jgi:hypothetical protein
MTTKKAVKMIICAPFILFLLTMFIPIKFCIPSLPTNNDEKFYIIKYIRSEVKWLIIGDNTGLYPMSRDPERVISPESHLLFDEKELSVDLFMHGGDTAFIVRGEATIIDDRNDIPRDDMSNSTLYAIDRVSWDMLYTIDATSWDILGKIDTMNPVRGLFPKSYLTIWDYRWFDVLRDHAYYYLDGQLTLF